jgi:hypothetical protein
VTRFLAAALFSLLSLAGTTASAERGLPDVDRQLNPGDRAVVLTALEGREIQEIPAHYVGTLTDFAGPGFDLHLFELEGPVADHIGVAAGMSGSPVFVDDRLVGALSYRIGSLPKDAIAGVTPIRDILGSRRSLDRPALDGDTRPIRAPVVVPGLHAEVREWAAPLLEPFGLVTAAGGATGATGAGTSGDGDTPPFVPGSPLGVGLVSGDMSIAATGTVTWVDGDEIYAFGHPFLGSGRTELPLHTATVVHTLADMLGPVKLAEVGPEVGAILDDRLPAVVGRLGRRAPMIPVEMKLRGGDYGEQAFHFDVVQNRFLTPVLIGMTVSNALVAQAGFNQHATLLVSGRVRLRDLPDLEIHEAYAGETVARHAVALASDLVQRLAGVTVRPLADVRIDGVELSVEATTDVRSYTVESLVYDRGPVRPGETLDVGCVVRRYRGGTEVYHVDVEIPETLAGRRTLALVVGSPERVARALGEPEKRRVATADDPASAIRALSSMRPANRLSAVIYDRPRGIVRDGRSFENLPSTARRLLGSDGASARTLGGAAEVLRRVERELDGPVSGGFVVRLEVEPAIDKEESP